MEDAEILEALEALIAYAETAEVTIDSEFGAGRSLAQILETPTNPATKALVKGYAVRDALRGRIGA